MLVAPTFSNLHNYDHTQVTCQSEEEAVWDFIHDNNVRGYGEQKKQKERQRVQFEQFY